jgi:hypothetical protein
VDGGERGSGVTGLGDVSANGNIELGVRHGTETLNG